ncbi:MAG TPA: acyl-protein synthetase [Polyangiaceae bacterium LLY-WYZ-15_(1-7)]|nr:acyl-protein synthetase [Sandaracinus sp.]HJL00465.1 acyl-protein synthetase [Polyangiaceae bacterium LLY-WYZ-15_(1-7)]MBJ72932.1 acyl-protein synthetase [Sandaracinus sp.]HJL07106.1 acyl-protein synthetase [Polyangiaceae bacterium LLY-WYZ-15_(1-7)]HJL21639.1 acyl-protein synthetase [Polyangiaceae bacterium LLY-WYZ-15_(1-7)]
MAPAEAPLEEARAALRDRALALVARLGDGARDDAARDALLADLAAFQARHVAPYGNLVRARGAGAALPTDVFRHARVAAHPPSADLRVFRTSGTTHGARGAHAFRDLALYDAAARAWAKHMLFPDVERLDLVVLAPHEDETPDSSLGYMLARFAEWFGRRTRWVWREGGLDLDALREATRNATGPVALLGTSFAFVHADDGLGDARVELPAGSRVMQTGGFKGRSRELEPAAMRAMLTRRWGVPESHVVAEYGMTELSSQAYETPLRDAALGRPIGARRLLFPGWVRATPVDPATLAPTAGEGILRIDDAANLDSVAALQTADRSRRVEVDGDAGFVVLGRAPGAVPRGCSLAVEEALARSGAR